MVCGYLLMILHNKWKLLVVNEIDSKWIFNMSVKGCLTSWRDEHDWNCNFVGFITPSLLAWACFATFGASLFNFLNRFLWLSITGEGSVPEMRIWSILLTKSKLKWHIHLRVALTGFMRYFICRVVLQKLTASAFVSYYFTILSYISIKFLDHVLS